MSDRACLLIGGRRRAGSGPAITLTDPSTGDVLTGYAEAGPGDIDRAVAAARREADGGWGASSPAERAAVLRRCATAVESAAEEIALLQAREMGRPVTRGREGDVPAAAATLRYFARLAEGLREEQRPTELAACRLGVRLEPVGVVAAMIPWNMPVLLASWVLAPALAAGCAVLLKPSETAPLAVVELCARMIDAGLPPGALAALPGRGPVVGAALADHAGVDAVAFTGSVPAGRRVAAAAGARGARVTLELGGKNALIVLDDADPAAAAAGAAHAAFANAGQACSSGSRVIATPGVAGRLAEGIAEQARALRPGHACDPATRLGPLATAAHRDRVLAHVDEAIAAGARALAGPGRRRPDGGHFMEPTVLVDVPTGASCLRDEIFGPVVTVQVVPDEETAVREANATELGLTAGVWARDAERAERVAAALRAGTVWVNCWHVYDPAAPFGGRGASGFGRSGGPESLARFTDTVAVWRA